MRKLLVAIIGLIALTLIALAGWGGAVSRVAVPSLTRHSLNVASRQLAKAGLCIRVRGVAAGQKNLGKVIHQSPSAGMRVSPRSRVVVTVDVGPLPIPTSTPSPLVVKAKGCP
jgi:beta-lactam-binding protein with PASTA domain